MHEPTTSQGTASSGVPESSSEYRSTTSYRALRSTLSGPHQLIQLFWKPEGSLLPVHRRHSGELLSAGPRHGPLVVDAYGLVSDNVARGLTSRLRRWPVPRNPLELRPGRTTAILRGSYGRLMTDYALCWHVFSKYRS